MSDIEWSPWIQHTGDECPVEEDVRAMTRFKSGRESFGIHDAGEWRWAKSDDPGDINHYRIPMEDYRRITGMPRWEDAPEWAQWLAQDLSGNWYWYQIKPHKEMSTWDTFAAMTHRHTDSPMAVVLGNWEDTLQERPSDPMDTHPDSELDADQYSVGADTVDHPSHYTSGSIECIDAIQAQMTPEQFAGYLRGNVAKYVWRYEHKGGAESLRKARWYLDRLIAVMEDE